MISIKHNFFLFTLLWLECVQVQGLKIVIEGFNGTLSKDSLSLPSQSQHLKIGSNQIRKIQTGAICTISLLQIVEIEFKVNTDPPILTQNMFENCDNITELKIFGNPNHPSQLNHHIFQNLRNLKSLAVQVGAVERLTKDIFTGLTSLINLSFSKCRIKEIDSSVFDDLKKLEDIKLDNNEITILPKDLFKDVPNLKSLNLANNNISNLDWTEFNGLSSLRFLNLGFNQISIFDVEKIVKSMPKLEHIVIKHNALDCYSKEKIAGELARQLNHTVLVSFYDFIYFDYTDCDAEEYHRSHLLQS